MVLTLVDRELASPDRPLVGTKWWLDSVGSTEPDGSVSSVPQGMEAWIQITGDRIAVDDGCNTGGGVVTVSDDSLDVPALAATKMACADPGGIQAAFREVFGQGPVDYEITEGRLTLTKGDVSVSFAAR